MGLMDGPLLVADPGHINDVSRWFVQSMQALGVPYNHDFNGPAQRGVRGALVFGAHAGEHADAFGVGLLAQAFHHRAPGHLGHELGRHVGGGGAAQDLQIYGLRR